VKGGVDQQFGRAIAALALALGAHLLVTAGLLYATGNSYAVAVSGATALLVVLVLLRVRQRVVRLEEERRELLDVQASYLCLFDNAVAGVLLFRTRGELVAANPALARILGYESPLDLSRRAKNVHREIFADPEHRTRIADGRLVERKTPLLRRDGTVVWVLESTSVVRPGNDERLFAAVLVDVTELVTAQDELRELSRLLLDSQEQERRRIARDLHDSTGQVLAALEMNLSRIETLLGSASHALSETGALATQCSREIRSMSYLLHPPLLDELGLVYAVRDYAEGFAKRSGIAVELDLPREQVRFPRDAESALFRVIQEALTNVHRHAESPAARIRLEHSPEAVVVTVADDGRGIPPDVRSAEGRSLSWMGVGMRGMEERLRQLGGRLTVTSSSSGTVVRAELPRTIRSAHAAEKDSGRLEAPRELPASARNPARSPGARGL
jgi:PAS domain S-box-containing protein